MPKGEAWELEIFFCFLQKAEGYFSSTIQSKILVVSPILCLPNSHCLCTHLRLTAIRVEVAIKDEPGTVN